MKKYILLVSLVVSNAYADTAYQQKVPSESENDILTSQEYVNDRVGRSQDLIQPLPAGTTVDKIVTRPTTLGGTPGARDIVTDLTNGASNGIPTSGTVYTANAAKNDKIRSLNDQNVVTYTGTTSSSSGRLGPGVTVGTPIYSAERNTYKNGLVRASTLNAAVQYAIDHELTRNDSDPQGTLWDVTALTAPAPLPVTANLPQDSQSIYYCGKYLTDTDGTTYANRSGCTESRWGPNVSTPNEYSHAGDWGAVFPYDTGISADGVTCTGANSANCNKEIRGISAVISGTLGSIETYSVAPSSLWPTLDAAYEEYKNGKRFTDYDINRCYCKLTAPVTNGTASHWVYRGIYGKNCSLECSWALGINPTFRAVMFGAYSD
ncbi:MAG: hypothetical protein J6T57_00355, partial [Alphaproteobacteria bacterium]|nr:hypothetical protein [Alphaproteobacteria bacterium]